MVSCCRRFGLRLRCGTAGLRGQTNGELLQARNPRTSTGLYEVSEVKRMVSCCRPWPKRRETVRTPSLRGQTNGELLQVVLYARELYKLPCRRSQTNGELLQEDSPQPARPCHCGSQESNEW